MPVDWTQVENTLATWLIESTGLEVRWEDQDGPQPAGDYATLQTPNILGTGTMDTLVRTTDVTRPPGQEVETQAQGLREVPVTVQVFTAATRGPASAVTLLNAARTRLELPGVRERLRAGGASLFAKGEVRNLAYVAGTRWRGRAALSLRVYVVESSAERGGYIASVGLSTTH